MGNSHSVPSWCRIADLFHVPKNSECFITDLRCTCGIWLVEITNEFGEKEISTKDLQTFLDMMDKDIKFTFTKTSHIDACQYLSFS